MCQKMKSLLLISLKERESGGSMEKDMIRRRPYNEISEGTSIAARLFFKDIFRESLEFLGEAGSAGYENFKDIPDEVLVKAADIALNHPKNANWVQNEKTVGHLTDTDLVYFHDCILSFADEAKDVGLSEFFAFRR
jgi:hypothetical protein